MMIDLREWEFIATNGVFLVGKIHPTKPRTFSPVFEALRPFTPRQQSDGELTVTQAFLLRPFLSIPPGARSLTIPEGAFRVSLDALNSDKEILPIIEQALVNETAYRAQALERAGIALPPGSMQ